MRTLRLITTKYPLRQLRERHLLGRKLSFALFLRLAAEESGNMLNSVLSMIWTSLGAIAMRNDTRNP